MNRRFRHAPRGDALFGPRTHWCNLCDYGFSLLDEGDLAAHERRHERMLELVAEFGPLMTREQRRDAEGAMRASCSSGAPLAERTAAAAALLHARHHGVLRDAAKGSKQEIPEFDEFVPTVDVESLFPKDVQRALRGLIPTLAHGARARRP